MDVRVPQGCADVIEEPGQWAQLQEGFLEGQGCHLMSKCPVLKGPQRAQAEAVWSVLEVVVVFPGTALCREGSTWGQDRGDSH